MFSVYLPIAGMEFSALVLLTIGFAVGVLAGFFGIGGGWIITPSLHIFGLPVPFAIGTGLANVAGQSAVASAKHRQMGNVDHKLGVTVGLAMIAGVEGGKRCILALEAMGLADSAVRVMYMLFLGGLGLFMLWEYIREMRRRAADNGRDCDEDGDDGSGTLLERVKAPPMIHCESLEAAISVWPLIGIGVVVGFLAGVMGSGGGFALVPLFVFAVGVPTYVAVSTSLLCVTISGAYGTFTYALGGKVEIIAALWILAGSAVGSQLGGSAVRYVRGYGIRLMYSLMLLVAAASVLLKHLDLPGPAAVAVLGGAVGMCLLITGALAVALLKARFADGEEEDQD
ncbi:MAG: sulfite exporter TauE/SafE family protein [Candidatus Brocadiia bacterium]